MYFFFQSGNFMICTISGGEERDEEIWKWREKECEREGRKRKKKI